MYESCSKAAEARDLEELKKMHLSGYPWDAWTPFMAALNGHLECLRYSHENGCRWDEGTPARAALNGHLDCLKYAHQNGCRWNDLTPTFAAKNGHLECLKYAHENGCRWDEWTPARAIENGHFECFKYCFERWNDPQEFWNNSFYSLKLVDKIDLDEPLWRRLFKLDLSKYTKLQQKVEEKKREITQIQEECLYTLYTRNIVPKDVVIYCIFPFV